MPAANDLLLDAFDRVQEGVPSVVDGLSVEDLLWRPDPDANHIAWLVWHLSRVQDDHLAALVDQPQVYVQGWSKRFGLPYPEEAHGYGHTRADVDAFVLQDPALLTGYHAAVHERTVEIVRGLDDAGLARVVDERWDPPVTAAVRLVSVVNDGTQHIGQAAYVRGLAERRSAG